LVGDSGGSCFLAEVARMGEYVGPFSIAEEEDKEGFIVWGLRGGSTGGVLLLADVAAVVDVGLFERLEEA